MLPLTLDKSETFAFDVLRCSFKKIAFKTYAWHIILIIFAGKWFIIMSFLPSVMFYAQNLTLMKDRMLVYVLLFYSSSYEVNILMRALSVYCQPLRTVNFVFAHSFNPIIIWNLLLGLERPHRLFFSPHILHCVYSHREKGLIIIVYLRQRNSAHKQPRKLAN